MEYTHYVRPGYDNLGQAGEVMEFDENRSICLIQLHAIKGIQFVAVVEKNALTSKEVIR